MGPPSYMRPIFDRNVVIRRIPVYQKTFTNSLNHPSMTGVSWGISLTNIVQPVKPVTIGCDCGQTYRLHVFLTWDMRSINSRISLVRVLKIQRRHLGVVYLGPWRCFSVILSPFAKRTCRSRIFIICRWARMNERVSSYR